jgi:glycosyltransferase A (GT-A) superfamily protein (DUF2064 family)
MAEAPIPGEVKLGLCPPLDPPGATELHERFVSDALTKARAVPDAELLICYTPARSIAYFRGMAPTAAGYLPQEGRSLSERALSCFDRVCEPGRAVVILGTDSPTLPARCIELAFDGLATGRLDIVIGPTVAGGCYLLGATETPRRILDGLEQAEPTFADACIARAATLGLDWYLLPEWYEVRNPMDLAHLKCELLDRWVANHSAEHTREFLRTLAERGML